MGMQMKDIIDQEDVIKWMSDDRNSCQQQVETVNDNLGYYRMRVRQTWCYGSVEESERRFFLYGLWGLCVILFFMLDDGHGFVSLENLWNFHSWFLIS